MKLKTKLSLGLSFLFAIILAFGILGIFYINRLSSDSAKVLRNNHESLVYCNNMLKALEDIPADSSAEKIFDDNLQLQEKNVTEPGEDAATIALRKDFTQLLSDKRPTGNYIRLRQGLQKINDLNQSAILTKNSIAQANAAHAKFWLTAIFCTLMIAGITFILNFPSVIATPVTKLSEGIKEIAGKNYKKRIFLEQKDEFGELAASFNSMAEKLDEYEHSNLAQLRFEKSRIETIINQMRDAVIGLDDKHNILFLNAVAERLLGLKEFEIAGKAAADVARQNDLMKTLLSEAKGELKIFADNKESYFDKDLLHVTSNGNIIGQLIVLKNITPFHERSEAKTNFIATISHELKTPISSIKMSAKLLSDSRVGAVNEEQVSLIKSIADDSDRLLKITSELLNLSQAETGNIQLKIQPSKPSAIVEAAVSATDFNAKQKSILVESHFEENLPEVNADAEKTSWVLINFLTNAIRYSSERSLVDIHVYRKNDRVFFEVTDKGIGIEEKYVSRVFDRYFKMPSGSGHNSTGLGLAISKEFIEAQGGTVAVRSEPGKGTAISFSLGIAS
ncbi:ATP-binding protein [Ferruginibacter sp. HRS2-29]|uniref:sensor histidine kinase n=1 Tax=Ferruginibacter sp. HRS2-29 TaxID=2487334 RepID=UPI0020CD2E8E|nr:ATP-binding protein [Ferruginibacter sp. HRS2-29]MCP9749939.1 HAMP domain-containing protein [Ferruginibacter sp. HRS2-29]